MLGKISFWISSSLRRLSAFWIVLVMSALLTAFIVYDIQTQRDFTEEALLSKGKMMAMNGASFAQHTLEDAINSGRLSEEQVFDTNYIPIPNTYPQKYHTSYDRFTDQNLLVVEDSFLKDSDIAYAVIVDINGYLPTHNSIFTQPLSGNADEDIIKNRTKRIFNDETGLAAARNTQPYLKQIYHRDTGETMWDISAPILVNGKHWGAFRIGFSLIQVNSHLNFITWRSILAGLLIIMAVFGASYLVTSPMALLTKLSQSAEKIAQGDVSQQIKINRADEVGILSSAFNHIIDYHREMAETANRISLGDLGVKIIPKSSQDTLSIAFIKMVQNLQQNIQSLEKERTLLQTLIDNSADIIYFKDIDSRFIRISQSQARRFGLKDVSQAEGKTDFDFFTEEHARPAFEDEQYIIKTGISIINKEEKETWPDGRVGWVSSTKIPFYDEKGQIIGTFGISRNITEQKRMEMELKANQDRMQHEIEQRIATQDLLNTEKEILNTTLLSINEGVIATDESGLITFINHMAEEITGFEFTEALEQPVGTILKILNPHSEQAIPDVISKLFGDNKNKIESINYKTPTIQAKSGDKKLIEANIATINSKNNKPLGYVIVFQDVTEKQKIETQSALSQKMESIGQLASGIAHEINTPIQYVGDNLRYLNRSFIKIIEGIQVYQACTAKHVNKVLTTADLDSVESQIDARKVQRYIEDIPNAINESLEGVERVRKIVLAMREFTHPSQKEKHFADINHGIETTITISRNEWKYVADLETDLESDLPLVNCQIDEINQVILNMVVNSAQAIQDKILPDANQKGKIWVKTRKHDQWVQIIISDTGSGIPESIKKRVFDPFFTTKGVGKGTGQGLYLAHNIIVNKHGGHISLESETGQGTTFIIELPISGEEK